MAAVLLGVAGCAGGNKGDVTRAASAANETGSLGTTETEVEGLLPLGVVEAEETEVEAVDEDELPLILLAATEDGAEMGAVKAETEASAEAS